MTAIRNEITLKRMIQGPANTLKMMLSRFNTPISVSEFITPVATYFPNWKNPGNRSEMALATARPRLNTRTDPRKSRTRFGSVNCQNDAWIFSRIGSAKSAERIAITVIAR